jgi:multiple sugar transport system permease protein
MPLISIIGRNRFKARALYLAMYAFLLLGAASMVYPFLLMISGSTKGGVDAKYFDVVPRFLRDDTWLYRKHIECLFNESMTMRNTAYGDDGMAFDTITPPPSPGGPDSLVADWQQFLSEVELPPYVFTVGHLEAPVSRTIPWQLRDFKRTLRTHVGTSIEAVNAALDTQFVNWNALTVQARLPLARRDKPLHTPFGEALYEYQAGIPPGLRVYASVDGFYRKQFLKPQYSARIEEYNRTHGTCYADYGQVPLPRTFPADGTALEQTDWEAFVRHTLGLVWLRAAPEAAPAYRAFLEAKYGTLSTLNARYGTAFSSFEQIPMAETPPPSGVPASDWEAFLAGWREPVSGRTHTLPIGHIRIDSLESRFGDWLAQQGRPAAGIVSLPQERLHHAWFLAHRGALKREFMTRNYKAVADYLLLHGRGIFNTVVYCSLAVLFALTINPLAAYAMSRYRMPSSYKILLFLMCTMAFPPMVTQIPSFLMLRQLGMLNTFAALVLPGMANGYAIFLLKGFFDSQPRELYESAQLDGASEWTIFWQITMSLSKPILAVIALQAFTLAYSNFMFAFVVCQDERMWTLMVWLYQLQQRSGQAVMYASLIIAAIPTFMIFLFCQNIIMRGIVVPSEK